MNIIFVLAVTMCIEKSGSQILTHSPDCFSNGNTLTINCETPALNDIISFTLNGGNKGSCRPGLGCGSNITQADTTTSLAIQYNETEHDGSWRCKFGLSLSPVVIIAENPCVVTTEGTKEGPTVTTEMPFKSSSLDQTASSQNPSTDTSKTQKTNTNRISTTDNVLTFMFPHFTSDHEVTTKISNRSNNAMEFSVGAVIAIVFSGIISVCLVVLFVCLYLRRKHTRKQTSETSQPKLKRTNEKQNKGQYSRKNVRGQTIDPSTYPTDYYDSGNPRTKNFNKMSNHRQKHSNENLNYELSQSMQNNIEDKITINYRSSRTHQTRAKNRGPPIPLAHFAPNNSKNYRCVSNMLYVDPHEPHAYMCQDYFVYPAYDRIQDRQSGQHCYY